MRFKKGDRVFFEWIGEPKEIEITGTWGEKRYKFMFIGKDGSSGWTLKETEVFSSIKELANAEIELANVKIKLLESERGA